MKIYIGDSVYAEMIGTGVKLTTENGSGPSNTIYLEREVFQMLVEYVESRLGVKFEKKF